LLKKNTIAFFWLSNVKNEQKALIWYFQTFLNMKKILLMASLLAFGQAVQAQSLRPSFAPALKSAQENPANGPVTTVGTENTVLYSEDFGSGLGTWQSLGFSSMNMTAVHDTTGVWEYRGTATVPTRATGSRGAYGSAAPLASPTTANGFMIFDSDWLDDAGVAGAFGTGVYPSPHRGMLISPSINLTGQSFVNLEFYQYYRRFAGPGGAQTAPATYVLFSRNDGATWSDTLMLNNNIAVNAATTNPAVVRVNVSNFIGNNDSVKVAFLFNGDFYVWMIDDVKLTEIPNNDLAITTTVMLPDTANGRTLEYGTMPIQNKTPLTFQARIRNNGKVAQPNVRLNVTVADTLTNTFFTGASAQLASLAAFTDTLLTVTTNYPATDISYMRINYATLSDSTDGTPADNLAVRQLSITDSTFSPAVAVPATQGILGTGQFGTPAAQDVGLANLFELVNQDTVTSATARLNIGGTAPTQVGALVQFSIRTPNPADGLPGDATTIVVESDIYSITQEDIANGFIRVDFPAELGGLPQNRILTPGDYWLQADLYSNTGVNRVRFLDDLTFTQPWFVSVLYTTQWFSNGNALRMSLNMADAAPSTISVAEINKDLKLNVYPNPAKNILNLSVASDASLGRVSYQVMDIAGRIVSSEAVVINSNNEVIPVDISSLQNGVYSIVVKTSKGYNTSRFVVAQ